MNYFIKKVWYSAILSIIIIVTAVTSTYAWYAMTYNNDIDEFDFTIGGTNSVLISADGKNFATSLSSYQIKQSIISKRGIDIEGLSESDLDKYMSEIKLDTITPIDYTNLSLGFENITTNSTSKNYLSFDLYLTSDYVDTTGYGQAIYFTSNDIILAQNKNVNLNNYNINYHPVFGNINRVSMNIKDAMRIGISKSELVDISNLDSSVLETTIYTPGTEEASVTEDGVYSFGGINASPNVALNSYNSLLGTNLTLPKNDRRDIEIDCNKIIDETDGLVQDKMIKLTVYLWLEGWDADAFDIFKGSTFDFNLSFATYKSD